MFYDIIIPNNLAVFKPHIAAISSCESPLFSNSLKYLAGFNKGKSESNKILSLLISFAAVV